MRNEDDDNVADCRCDLSQICNPQVYKLYVTVEKSVFVSGNEIFYLLLQKPISTRATTNDCIKSKS
ncbi:MAG: hypothetical protein LBT09_09035 [Planctomycetaceae bacterium]|nr:hypothetical protein [Planctomycetaceae bacterium]